MSKPNTRLPTVPPHPPHPPLPPEIPKGIALVVDG